MGYCFPLTAYGKKHYTEIVECLKECASKLNDPKPISAQEILGGDILCDDIHCAFVCETCGCVLNEWTPICNKCQSIDSYIHKELSENYMQ